MLYVVALAAVFALLIVIVLLLRDHRDAERQWTAERRELLNRVQAPERLPVPTAEMFEQPDWEEKVAQEREWAKVGEIDIDSDYEPS